MRFEQLEAEYLSPPEDPELDWCRCGRALIDVDEQDVCDACMNEKENSLELENE